MLRSPAMHLPNALNHLVEFPCGIKLQVPTVVADLIPPFRPLVLPCLSSPLASRHPCTSQISHLHPNPCLRVSFREKPTWDKSKGHLRKTALRASWALPLKLPRWGVWGGRRNRGEVGGVGRGGEGARRGREGHPLHSTGDSPIYIRELSLFILFIHLTSSNMATKLYLQNYMIHHYPYKALKIIIGPQIK